MKKHLLLNQLFGTEGSPNQTDETLTRENRIGLMSYLRRTLMLLFAVLVMSVANVGVAWGTSYAASTFFQAVATASTATITPTEANAGTGDFVTKDCSSAFTLTTSGSAIIGYYSTSNGTTAKGFTYDSNNGGLKTNDVGVWIVFYSLDEFVAGDSIVIANGNASGSGTYVIVGAAANNTSDYHSLSAVSTVSTTQPAKNSNYYYILPNNFTTSHYLAIRANNSNPYTGGLYAYHAITCAAADLSVANITSDGDQIVGTGITFSKVGDPASGDTWYWQTSATGTDKTYDASSADYTTSTTAGRYTVYLRAYNSSADCWGTAIGKTNTVISCPFDVYNGENVAKGSTTASGWTINSSSSMAKTSGSSNGYSYWYQAGSSSDYVQFDGSISLVSGDKIKIQWTHTNGNDKTLALTINGSSVSLASGSTAKNSVLTEAIYNVTSATNVTSIKLNSSGSSGCIIYKVSIVKAACESSCTAPTGLTKGDTGSTSQEISWTAPASAPEDGYLVAYSSATSTAPGTDVTATGGNYTVVAVAAGTTTATMSALSASTTYYWWVRSKCGDSSFSSWVAGTSFTTDAPAATRTFKSNEKIYFKDAVLNNTLTGSTKTWKIVGGDIFAYFYDGSGNHAWANVDGLAYGTQDADAAVYRFIVPQLNSVNHEWTTVIFTRAAAGSPWTFEPGSGFWNKTGDQTAPVGKNMFIVKDEQWDNKWNGTWDIFAPDDAPTLIGTFNGWNPDVSGYTFVEFSDNVGKAYITLDAETTYDFKIVQGPNQYSFNNYSITGTTTTAQQLYTGNSDCHITTTEAGEYVIKYNKSNHQITAAYYPKTRFIKDEYLYVDTRNSNWNVDIIAKYIYSYYDNSSGWIQDDFGRVKLDGGVYYDVVPNRLAGYVRIARMNPSPSAVDGEGKPNDQWDIANQTSANDRTDSKYNCMSTSNATGGTWHDFNMVWTIYCPPTTSETLSDNSTTVIEGTSGDGTSEKPFLVPTSGTIKVSASASKAVPDGNMTINYDFKVGGSSEQAGEGNTYSKGSLSNNTTYTMSVDAYTVYNLDDSKNSTKHTPTALYYKALDVYTISYNKGSNGTGDNTTAEKIYDISKTLLGVTFTRTGYTQTAWNTDPSGTGGTSYALSGSYAANAAVTLYPTWTAKTTTVTLNPNTANHGTGSNVVITATYDAALSSFSAAVPAAGYQLKGYYTDATGGTKVIDADGTFSANSGTWNRTDGATLELFAQYEDASYSVTHTLSNVTKSSGATTATHGTNYTAVFAGAAGYNVPDAITVTIGGSTKTAGTEYTWDSSTGTIEITGSYITGAIVITVTGEEEGDCTPSRLAKVTITGGSSSYTVTDSISTSTHNLQTVNGVGGKIGGSGYLQIYTGGTSLKTGDKVSVSIRVLDYSQDRLYMRLGRTTSTDTMSIYTGGVKDKDTTLIFTIPKDGIDTISFTRATGKSTSTEKIDNQNHILKSVIISRPCAGETYNITYHCNDATSGCPSDATDQTALPNPLSTPTKTNYTFGGWYTDAALSSAAVAGETLDDDADLYAKWTQTITLKTGAQGSGADKTPTVVWQGTALNGFSSAHTADGYTLQGYYTAGSGGVKVLNADGSFASANVDGYITSSKWSRTGAAPTLFAQWRAAGGASCNTIDHISDFPSSGSPGMTVGNLKVTYSGNKVSRETATIYSGKTGCNVLKIGGNGTGQYVQGYLGGNEISSLELGVEGENNKAATPYCVAFSASSTFDDESVLSWSALNSQKNTNTSSATSDTLTSITVPSGAKYFRIYRKASFNSIELGAGSSVYVWHIKACTAGASTHTITYANGGGTGTMTSDADIEDDGTQILKTNTFTAPTNYSFAGWVADVNVTIGGSTVTAGTLIANSSTITNITSDIALTAKWSQSLTLDDNDENHGATGNGSATAYYNATSLSSITHTKATTGYKLSGYYTAKTDGTKVLNADGSFVGSAVTGWISDSKWTQSTTSTPTLYAQYESAGALTWNLIVNSDTTALSTSTKTSAFTEISTTNMTNATLAGDLTYEKSKKSALTGKISTPASYDADDYVYVTFQVASGYKFTPSSIKVIAQPVTTGKDVKLSLTDGAYHSLVSSSATSISGGSTQTVTLAGDGTYFTGTVTLKIYCYGATDKYRLGTPITIEGEVEEACATMPSYKSMSYTTTTFAPDADASGSPITIVGGDNINTYQWKYNTVNDRTSGTDCGTGTSLTPLTDDGAETDVTRYYWCEMTNDVCGITIKSPAVAITVAAAKSDASVTWTDPATPNYGGGGYTIKATVNEIEWDGNAADLVITAPAGINIYNVTSGTTSDQKWVQADFDVQTSFDRTTYASNIPFTVSAAATASYNAISDEKDVDYSACTGGGEGSSYNIRMRKTVTKDGNYYHCANTDGWISPNINSSYSTGIAGTKMETDFDTVASSNTQYVWVRTYHANVNKVRIYADFRANDMTVSNVYKHTAYFSADSKYAVDYTVVYNNDEENENTGTAAQGYVDITLDEVMAANDILLVKFNDSKVRPLGAIITEGSAGSLNTYLRWSGGLGDGATVAKNTTDAYFTYSASKITENTNTLGTITYSSSNTSVATVDATGKVAMVAAGETTIKATLAASGCYKKAEISYTLNVTVPECTIAAGTLTLTSGSESKCSSDKVTLELTGFESGADIQWKDGDTDIDDGGNYKIVSDGTTSTLTTDQEGTYSVMVTSGCSVRSNRITISNKSTEVGAKRIVKNWYIKNGRLTPDIELWTLQNGAHLSSVAWDPANTTGLTASDFYESDGKVYLKGKEPSSNTSADIDYTLTLTVADDCGSTTEMSAAGQQIYLHHQKNTDKHVLAFVVTGTEKGGFTEGITADQTTSVELYNTIAANFDVLATNVYSTDDEQALKEYYSQFDILCVTDYPNTGTKGVNKKSYVDALGALVDIRPILTMEAFVAKLANWKAKGISGTPQSPTTRQYSMDLQCKDHEIFAGTNLTKVGEGDEAMYRVSMVCDTLEDYKTLDATYGSGTHEEKKNYNYGGKPALQGFTFTKEMLDDDLLPLGLIDDGSGNDLQVGIERQAEMEARLMVLGINGYAMERLTPDGQKVVVNALKYLMKKNSEDIADCSNTFVGGDDEEDESTRYNWDVASHWSGNAVPDRTQKVRIVARCVIPANVKPHVTGVIIAPSGKYNHGANTANGSLTIAAGGALIVDGKVEAATAPLYTETRATSAEDLTIQTSSTAQGALIFDNDKGDTKATVKFYSLGRNDGAFQYQYIASPMEVVPVSESYHGSGVYTYVYTEAGGWERRGYYTDLYAFEGVAITTRSATATEYTVSGTLAHTNEREIDITVENGGDNMIGNSWTAPIQISELSKAPNTATLASSTVYVYCSGRDATLGTGASGSTEVAGQWLAVPFNAASFKDWTGLKVIPAMNAFEFLATAAGTITLNYDTLVRGGSQYDLTAKARAPKRIVAHEGIDLVRIRVADTKTHNDIHLFEGDVFSEAFDDGWEAKYMTGEGISAQLYAMNGEDKMAVLATSTLEGTVLGFAPGREREYTFSFHGADNGYYLNDLKLKTSTPISETEHYTFTYEEGDTHRFYISKTRIDAPQTPTDVTNPEVETPKAQKFIYKDKMYIMINGRVYSAEGALVK